MGVFSSTVFSSFCISTSILQKSICSEFSSEYLYNHALQKAKSGDFSGSQNILSHISLINFPEKSSYYELLGDVIFASSGSVDDVMTNYKKSFDLKKEPRVEKKISLLENHISGEKNIPSSLSGSEITSSFSGSAGALESSHEKIESDEQNRSKFLSFPSMTDTKTAIQDTIDFVDSGKERVDW